MILLGRGRADSSAEDRGLKIRLFRPLSCEKIQAKISKIQNGIELVHELLLLLIADLDAGKPAYMLHIFPRDHNVLSQYSRNVGFIYGVL